MLFLRLNPFFVAGVLALLLFTACGGKAPSRWDKAQEENTKPKPTGGTPSQPTTPPKPVAGGEFNKFFPKASTGFEIKPMQEKEGFAEHKLKKAGKDLAMLSINDVANLSTALDKFKQSTQKIAGCPAIEIGNSTTAILVANRFQVKAISRSPEFPKAERDAWLQKFDLTGLATLK